MNSKEIFFAGFWLAMSFLFLVLAGVVVPSFFSVGFMVLSGAVFYGRLKEYKEKMGKFYLVCEKLWGMLFVIVAILYIFTAFLTNLVPGWILFVSVVISFGFFVHRILVELRK